VLTHLIVTIISQCKHVSEHHNICTFLLISCVSGFLMCSRDFSKIFTCKYLKTIDIGLPRRVTGFHDHVVETQHPSVVETFHPGSNHPPVLKRPGMDKVTQILRTFRLLFTLF